VNSVLLTSRFTLHASRVRWEGVEDAQIRESVDPAAECIPLRPSNKGKVACETYLDKRVCVRPDGV